VRSDGRPRDRGKLIGPSPFADEFRCRAGSEDRDRKGGLILVAPDHPLKRIRLVVDGTDLPLLPDRVRVELDGGHADVVVFEVGALVSPDLRTIDALARACLTARRDGCELRLSDASTELRELLELAGLAQAVPCVEGSGLEGEGQPEGREEPRRVEEEGDPADPVP
jgi:anti-anti-sigma regulatory factor